MYKIIAILAIWIVACVKEPDSAVFHDCPYTLCPYQGMQEFKGVIHTGETEVDPEYEDTDTYFIDMLHWEYPSATYDQLDSMLMEAHDRAGDDTIYDLMKEEYAPVTYHKTI